MRALLVAISIALVVAVGSADGQQTPLRRLRRGGLRRLRAWLGPRGGNEPVRRVRPGARGPHVRPDPRALLHRHRDREDGEEGGARPARRGSPRRHDLFDAALRRDRRDGRDVQAPQGRADAARRSQAPVRGRSRVRPCSRSFCARRRRDCSGSTGGSTEASSRSSRRASSCASSTSLRSRATSRASSPERCRTRWPAEALKAQAVAARSYALASLVKGKPFDLYSDPRSQVYLGVAGEKAVDDAGRDGHGRGGRAVRREGRDDVLLLDLGWQDRERRRRVRLQRPVPRLAARSVGQAVAVPSLGAGALGARTVQSKLGIDARVVDATGTATAVRPSSGTRGQDDLRRGVGSGLARPNGARPALDVDLGRRAPARPALRRQHRLRVDARTSAESVEGSPRPASRRRPTAPRGRARATRDAGRGGRDLRRREARADDCATDSRPRAEPLRRFSSRSRRASRSLVRPRLSPPSSPGPCARASREQSSRWSGARARRGSPSARRRSTAPERFALELDALVPAGSYRARMSATAGLAAGTSAVVQVSG